MRHDLPSGGWVELRDIGDVTERQLRPLKVKGAVLAGIAGKLVSIDPGASDAEVMDATGITESEAEMLVGVGDYLAVALICAWSWPTAVTADSVLDLPGKDYAHLQTIITPFLASLLTDFSADGVTDPKALIGA